MHTETDTRAWLGATGGYTRANGDTAGVANRTLGGLTHARHRHADPGTVRSLQHVVERDEAFAHTITLEEYRRREARR